MRSFKVQKLFGILAACGFLASAPAFASVVLVTSAPTTSDVVNWGQFAPATSIPNGTAFSTSAGKTGTVLDSGAQTIYDAQNTNSYDFAWGAYYLWTYSGPFTLNLANPYSLVSAQFIQANPNTSWTATISAYDGAQLLGSFAVNGTTNYPATGNDSQMYIGISSTSNDITSVRWSIISSSSNSLSSYDALGPVSLGSIASSSTSTSSAVPEPPVLGLLGFSLIGLLLVGRRRLLV